ncbi:MAG TPA: hypothetical protein VED40_23485 [Azospirillaceae bacterium]|nr:hypothetical protein [Azospirillaceae bacterium]
MKRLTLLLGLALSALPATAHAAGQPAAATSVPAFVPGTQDLPLMPGLAAGDEAVVFDKPDGRIVQAAASGTADPAQVLRFYADTLPQLGWTADGPGRWKREGERLDIKAERTGARTLIRFTLSPA